ncbi:MAG: hypothetical protein K2P81_15035 [Bacteriovoracaceae bacterium]|nr:hypothetical protein [Bacteriovoracaceae bacterium]
MRILVLIHFLIFSLNSWAQSDWVIISDSHSLGEFGHELASRLRSHEGLRFKYISSGGSAPLQWLNGKFTTPCGMVETQVVELKNRVCTKLLTPKFSEVLDESFKTNNQKIAVIIQGTNFSIDLKERSNQVIWARKLAQIAEGKSDRCLWIGPPNMRRKGGFDEAGVEYKVQIILEALKNSPCHFIDSRLISIYPIKGDGIHYHWPGSIDKNQIQEAQKWAFEVFLEIKKYSL